MQDNKAIWRRPSRLRHVVALGALFLITVLISSRSVLAQASPRELRETSRIKMAQGAYEEAIIDFMMLIEYLGSSKRDQIVTSMEPIYYNVALCHFFIGQFKPCEDAFKLYLKRYPRSQRARKAEVFIADSLRFRNKPKEAIKAYEGCLRKYRYEKSWLADIHTAIARCYLADGDWSNAKEPLIKVYQTAPDFIRVNWAATMLVTAYLKELDLDKVYPLVQYILKPNSFASRSVVFNMAALEAGDELFGEEEYRDALWLYRMVYSYDLVMVRSEEYLEYLRKEAERARRVGGSDPRRLMRLQESIGELEAELKVMAEVDPYDVELTFRISHGYMEMARFWEGREMFLHLHDITDGDQADEALYLAFQCSVRLLPWTRAYAIGQRYMDDYPGGEYFDPVTIMMGQMYAKEQNWPKVIDHLTRTLELSPRHASAAECMFLLGYASFMEEKFDDALGWFRKLNTKFPDNDMLDASTYWIGMTLLFQGKYDEAAPEFETVLTRFPSCIYAEDAAFRRAVCSYGASDFEDSDQRLSSFMTAYPESALTSEAHMMKGDIAGALGRPKEAVASYRRAMDDEAINIEFYNHCAFQSGTILVDDEDYAALRDHFQAYIRANREGANIPQAVYWVGISLWNTGEEQGALRYYREAVEKYGRDKSAIGIDMILDEWIGRIRRASGETRQQSWSDIRAALARARGNQDKTTELRMLRLLAYDDDAKPSEKQRVTDMLTDLNNLEHASPAVLQAMLSMAREKGDADVAREVAGHLIRTFPETDYALDARMLLAEEAIERGRATEVRSQKTAHYEEAIRHLDLIREVYASSGEAGQALVLLGRLYREQGKSKEADAAYKDVLGVKAWRPMWPEALYGRGECSFEKGRFEEAAAYYERIYVMYSHYANWTARAYLRRAEALIRAHQNEKARQVLAEMMGVSSLTGQPEFGKAKELLAKLGGDA